MSFTPPFELRAAFEWALATAALSIALAILGSFVLSRRLARLPADHFVRPVPARPGPFARGVGLFLVAAGVAMLLLPGPGVVTTVVGLIVLDLPWMRVFVVRLLRRPRLGTALVAARRRAGLAPLQLPDEPVGSPRRHGGARA